MGGQGIVDPRKQCDFAQVASWMACASFLAQTVPALRDIGSEREGDGGPRWGHLKPAWSRVSARGADFSNLIPEFSESTCGETKKGVQGALCGLAHAQEYKKTHEDALAINTRASWVVATAILSMSGQGALAWHGQIPFAPFAVLAPQVVLAICRFELNLPMRALARAVRVRTLCYCCSLPYDKWAEHHVLTVARGNVGGNRYSSHKHIVRQAVVISKEAGFIVSTHCAGFLGADQERSGRHATSDHVADLVITGIAQ